MRSKLSVLWLFAVLNYLYCDIVSLMDPELLPQFLAGHVEGTDISEGFLLGGSILIEIPIAMVVISKLVPQHPVNRWANIGAGTIMTLAQTATLFMGAPATYYAFFSVIEIATTAFIVWSAWRWRHEQTTAPQDALV